LSLDQQGDRSTGFDVERKPQIGEQAIASCINNCAMKLDAVLSQAGVIIGSSGNAHALQFQFQRRQIAVLLDGGKACGLFFSAPRTA
jgi:hypothetical protein